MLTIYFSGTGNSKYVAEQFSKLTNAVCHSIEDKVDFESLFAEHDTVCMCFPTHMSVPPIFMREFVAKHRSVLSEKKLVLLCTQMLFSGDGAKAMARLLDNPTVIYAKLIDMPNNITNMPFIPIRRKASKFQKFLIDRQIARVARHVQNGVVKLQGWSKWAEWLGTFQNKYADKLEEKNKTSFHTTADCNACGLCVKLCPVQNLSIENGKLVSHDKCFCCYRCANACPQKAAYVWINKEIRKQYKGVV